MKDQDWDAWIARHRGAEQLDLAAFSQGSSALLAALCLVKQDRPLTLQHAPQGLKGLADVCGVFDWFNWE